MLRFCYSCIIACICTYCWSNPYNIAPKAHVTASLPWIKLEWNEEQWINKIILYDRVNRYDHIAAVRVGGSNGFSKVYHRLPNHGLSYVINIPKMKVS